jgi:hypothetical protein
MRSQSAMISPMSHNTEARTNINTNDSEQTQRIMQKMRRDSSVKVNIRDNRYQLSEHSKANKIG